MLFSSPMYTIISTSLFIPTSMLSFCCDTVLTVMSTSGFRTTERRMSVQTVSGKRCSRRERQAENNSSIQAERRLENHRICITPVNATFTVNYIM